MESTGRIFRKHCGRDGIGKSVGNLYKPLLRALGSVFIQMRTEKIWLDLRAIYTRSRQPRNHGVNGSNQTAENIIEDCGLSRQQIKLFLGSSHSSVIRDVKTLLSNIRTSVKAANFMIATGLLDQFQHIETIIQFQVLL
jgi:hypothetical protein